MGLENLRKGNPGTVQTPGTENPLELFSNPEFQGLFRSRGLDKLGSMRNRVQNRNCQGGSKMPGGIRLSTILKKINLKTDC